MYNLQNTAGALQGLNIATVRKVDKNKKEVTIQISGVEYICESILYSFANKESGVIIYPQPGDQVVTAFLGNAPEKPLILGCVYNGDAKELPNKDIDITKQMYAKFPAGLGITITNEKDKQKVEILTKKGHKINLDDDQENVLVSSKDDKNFLKIDFKKGEIEIKADKKITLTSGTQDKIILEANKGLSVETQAGSVALKGKDVKIEAQANLEGKANAQLNLTGTAGTKVESSAILTLKGSMTKIN